ncbi:3'-5' exonuclease [Neisseria weixii]|uniref:3'-5' exonuclease n=1 Tax=Neisseria weixii TaxID=1853276 RepID=A0A3N4MKH6_9NEIS|nr:3'-5' exonuclease [Neisseria weixii]ATD65431.1 DNA polymerase III subunit epsilon [Neisseria weixii]RPD83718.1 3'-5' exonuclease [Neisseria weixii]RPD84258.1 3'-5' exonuclease [Neisseria weixii]
MFEKLKRAYYRRHLKDSKYTFLYEEHVNEMVSIDCETTSLNVKEAEIISIGAVKIRGNTILTSEPFYVLVKPEGMMEATNVTVHGLRPKDLSDCISIEKALYQLLDFIGGRPLVGYYLEYDVAMIDKFLKPLIGIPLPNRQIEVSAVYFKQEVKKNFYYNDYVDLRMASMIKTLRIPDLPRHNALNDAINVAMMWQAIQARK